MNLRPTYVWATHLPILAEMILSTDIPILEHGCGRYSSGIINLFPERTIFQIESVEQWQTSHSLKNIEDLVHVTSYRGPLLCLIDGPVQIDGRLVVRMDVVKYIESIWKNSIYICHDTEEPNTYGYDYKWELNWPFRRDYTLLGVRTTVVSERPFA